MDDELPVSNNRKLNRAIAITVVALSVATALGKIKDDNIVQAMQADTAAKLDYWNQYQADRLKLHLAQHDEDRTRGAIEARHYDGESRQAKAQALAAQAEYDAAGYRDDQFDLSDGFASIALAVTAISALVESWGLLVFGWGSAAFALLFIVAGFAHLPIHPDTLIGWLT